MGSKAEPNIAESSLLMGCAWLEKGRGDLAAKHLAQALETNPSLPGLQRWSAYLKVWQGDMKPALTHLTTALEQAPDDRRLRREAQLLRELVGLPPEMIDLANQPDGRLCFTERYQRTHHRSGWRYAVEGLYGLHHLEGVRFIDFLEDPFAWQHPRPGIRSGPELLCALRSQDYELRLTAEERNVIPLREPWVGFMHNPPGMPPWFHYQESPQTILAKPVWQASISHCMGLFALSEYAADWLRKATGKPVSTVLHPTETPQLLFDFERFRANPDKLIIQVGWWLRRLRAIDHLPIARDNPMKFTKLRLIPRFFNNASSYLEELRELEQTHERVAKPRTSSLADTTVRQHVSNAEYDRLLAENICFVHLYDASANNTVIECIVRATPILVNPLPAVVEYLGADYPLYFTDLEDAAAKAVDMKRLKAAHDYLLQLEIRNKLDQETFQRSVKESEVYLSL